MFEEEEVQTFSKKSRKSVDSEQNGAEKAPFAWSSLPIDLLIKYRDEITRHLPPLTLKEMNLEEEVILQYHSIRMLQTSAIDDNEIALNQRAQVANSVTSVLNKLTDMQESLYTSERFKRVENLLIRQLMKLPEAVAQEFIVEYERLLDSLK